MYLGNTFYFLYQKSQRQPSSPYECFRFKTLLLQKKTACLAYYQPTNYKEASIISWALHRLNTNPKLKKSLLQSTTIHPKPIDCMDRQYIHKLAHLLISKKNNTT